MANVDEERARRIEELVQQMGTISDPAARQIAQELMEAILELHGAGMDRMMEIVASAPGEGAAIIRQFAGDGLVSNLLLLHGLHPDDMETRVRRALAKLPGEAQVTGVFEGIVRVRISLGGDSMREAAAQAVRDAAPDAVDVVIEETGRPNGFVPLSAVGGMIEVSRTTG